QAGSCRQQRPHHVLKDASVAEVLGLARGVDPHPGSEPGTAAALRRPAALAGIADRSPSGALGPYQHLASALVARLRAGLDRLGDALDGEDLLAAQPQRLRALAVEELERQHPRPEEVRAVDTLEALGDHGAHAQELR